jgi:cell filamentation protein
MKSSASRYVTSLGDEGAFEPGSHGRVLKNLLGITSKQEMDRVERESLLNSERHFLTDVTVETKFTLDLIFRIHKHFLGRIYSWAGKIRTVNVSKQGFTWPPPQFLDRALLEFESDALSRLTPLPDGPLHEIAQSLAEVHAEFLMIHPFRDGNGRVARLIAMLMTMQAHRPPPYYSFISRESDEERTAYLEAVKQGYTKNYEPLTRFFERALVRGAEVTRESSRGSSNP